MLITDLPNEVIGNILRNLESLEELGHAILACRHFYHTFTLYKDIPGTVLASTWEPELLPLAVATELVGELQQPRTGDAVRNFVDSFVYEPEHALRAMKRMDVSSLLSMCETQSAVTDLAFDMAGDAFKNFDFWDYAVAWEEGGVRLSPAEATRFCRAMYRTQIYFKAFTDEASVKEGQRWLLTSFAMFEIEQIACVYDYLERLTIRLTRFTLARDPFFGSRQYDYLRFGMNPSIEQFINQGVVWLANLFNLDPQDSIRVLRDELREVAQSTTYARLYLALSNLQQAYREGSFTPIKEPRDNLDPDAGPPSALDWANRDLMEGELEAEAVDILIVPTMLEEDYGLREQAYVLWDFSRMKDQDLWFQIEAAPEQSSMEPQLWQFPCMRDWFMLCEAAEEDPSGLGDELLAYVCASGFESLPLRHNRKFGNALGKERFWQTAIMHDGRVVNVFQGPDKLKSAWQVGEE